MNNLIKCLAFGLLLLSCQSEDQNEAAKVAQKIKDNHCRMEAITKYVDDSWTAAIDEMGKLLPEWLPDLEREKILNLRYASLFRLFETYKDFDPQVHEIVDSMEVLDASWADSLRTLSQENQLLEMKLDSIYSTIHDAEMEKMVMEEVEKLQAKPCPENLLHM
ncbi:MAG TPA: hypothetical protein VKZ56_00605 [Membranihabitans sp.]|nr:hypothetical protein [Membranihabitans sp.]